MKFKLRIDPDDLLIFGIFSVFLLYVVAITIVNLTTFAGTGKLSGLNPFPAFGPDYILSTLFIFFFVLGIILFSVKSYIFDRDKGIGLTTEKKDKGYSRWAKDREIKNDIDVEEVSVSDRRPHAAGIPLMNKADTFWVDNGEYHTLVIGSTGSGKTQTVVLPQVTLLGRKGESMVITDPKGEIYEETANMLRSRGYQILLLNFRDPQQGNSWNPMALPYNLYREGDQDKAVELLDDLALNILYDESNKNADPFWEKTGADYFSGVALGLFEDAKPEEININSIALATTIGEDKFGSSTYIKEYFNEKDPRSTAAINASATIMAPDDTKDSILSVFKQKIKIFASRENLSEMLSYSDIDLESIGERKTAVFIVIQDEKKTYHALATILLKQIYETLIRNAQKHGGKLPIRTNFILDEFANMPPLKDVTTMITAARSRHIRFTMIVQNFAQLDQVYGKEEAETIRGNCGNLIYLITSELKALEEISKMCGEVKSKKDEKTASTPLVTVSDLQRMKLFDVIILRTRLQPYKASFIPYFKIDWGEKFPPSKYPLRKKREVHTFDIKAFVKAQKKKKLLEMMNEEDASGESSGPNSLRNRLQSATEENARNNIRKQEEFVPDFLRFNPDEDAPKRPTPVPTNLPDVRPTNMPETNIGEKPTIKPMADKPKVTEDVPMDFDVDELIKKIDAKLAELDKEEQEAKEKVESVEKHTEDTHTENIDDAISNITHLDTEMNTTKDINIDDNDDDDDEDFFDDFFDAE
ncbi:MAG: type IV secretory system conjugative DNA transfer family protein [Bacilli bacterium]|nr:type IV secretory system conjugative DNA transfer family protein [Bacilli bacterium]